MASSDRRQAGFTVLELLVVSAILAVVFTLAVPNVRDTRKRANESSAITYLKAIHSVQNVYKERDLDGDGVHQYATEGIQLAPHFMGVDFWTNGHNGYKFVIMEDSSPIPEINWGAYAVPIEPGKSGDFLFSIDQRGRLTAQIFVGPLIGPEFVIDDFNTAPDML
jgi:prepilin-type N-terminal cleavage/methylation domain-containing protein